MSPAEDSTGTGQEHQRSDNVIHGRQRAAEALLTLIRDARYSLDILSTELDPALYGSRPAVDAMARLALATRRSRIRILVDDPRPIELHGHRALPLAQRLAGRIGIRQTDPEARRGSACFAIADQRAVVHFLRHDDYAGVIRPEDRGLARSLAGVFEALWESGTRVPGLRRLDL